MPVSTGTFQIGAGLDYANLTAFAADIAATLTGPLIGEVADELVDEGSGGVTFSGIATTSTNRITLRGAVSHGLSIGTGSRVKANLSAGSFILTIGVDHMDVDGLAMMQFGGGGGILFASTGAAGTRTHTIENCLIHGINSTLDGDPAGADTLDEGIQSDALAAEFSHLRVWNNGFINVSDPMDLDVAFAEVRYCTALMVATGSTDVGYRDLSDVVNCAAFGFEADFLNCTGGDFNASSDGSAATDVSGSTNNLTNLVAADELTSIVFPHDLHLKSTSNLIGAGTPAAGITEDFEGDTRDVATPDIGADEFVAAGGGGQTIPVGQVTETSLAQPITGAKQRTTGLVTETDLSQSIAAQKARAVGQVTELDVTFAVESRKAQTVGLVAETDLAQPLAGAVSRTVNQVSETDLAQAIAAAKQRTIAQVLEADVAQSIAVATGVIVGQVSETNTAQAIGSSKARGIGQITEVDSVFAIGVQRVLALLQVAESDTVFALGIEKLRALGLVTEIDTAFAMTVVGGNAIGRINNPGITSTSPVRGFASSTVARGIVSRTVRRGFTKH